MNRGDGESEGDKSGSLFGELDWDYDGPDWLEGVSAAQLERIEELVLMERAWENTIEVWAAHEGESVTLSEPESKDGWTVITVNHLSTNRKDVLDTAEGIDYLDVGDLLADMV